MFQISLRVTWSAFYLIPYYIRHSSPYIWITFRVLRSGNKSAYGFYIRLKLTTGLELYLLYFVCYITALYKNIDKGKNGFAVCTLDLWSANCQILTIGKRQQEIWPLCQELSPSWADCENWESRPLNPWRHPAMIDVSALRDLTVIYKVKSCMENYPLNHMYHTKNEIYHHVIIADITVWVKEPLQRKDKVGNNHASVASIFSCSFW